MEGGSLRGEVAALADEQGDEHLVVGGNLAHGLGEVVVPGLTEGVQLLVIVYAYDGDTALVLDFDGGSHCDKETEIALVFLLFHQNREGEARPLK